MGGGAEITGTPSGLTGSEAQQDRPCAAVLFGVAERRAWLVLWIAFALLYGLAVGAMFHAMLTAPVGYEDADGWHAGEPPHDAPDERADALGSAPVSSLHEALND